MTNEEANFIGAMNMCDEISNEAYKKIMCHCEEQKPCEDCISREETMQIIRAWLDRDAKPSELKNEIEQMPSVTPQPKVGRWIEKDGFDGDTYYDCSICGNSWTTIDGTPWQNGMNYCPNCGAKMEVEGNV